jgi:glycolate oxidase
MMNDQKLHTSVLKELRKIVGPAHLFTDPEELTVYSYDATRIAALPWAVARPASTAEVSAIVRLANRERVPLVPRGAGSGMSGGSVPARGGVVLSFERMCRIIEISEADRIAVVEPGVVTGDLHRDVERRGLFYPPDPASSAFCTIGGNVAECAGGLRAVKYGVTRDYVLGLEAVLPTGEVVRTGSRTLKSVAGYDLTRLLVGSEGTLGVVTEITLRLLPLPEPVCALAAWFPGPAEALSAVAKIAAGRVVPRALEFMDNGAIRAVESFNRTDRSAGAGAMLLAETDGAAAGAELEVVENLCRAAGASRIERAVSHEERNGLWAMRKAISPALYGLKPRKLNEDIVVPVSRIGEMLSAVNAIAARHGLLIVCFGHAGDGNIHVNVMYEDAEADRAAAAAADVFRAAVRLAGSISGEHGIGLAKAAYLPLEADAGSLAAMRRIKQALDPNNIMNTGKIFLNADYGVRNAE